MSERDVVTTRVRVIGIVPADPPLLAFSQRLHGVHGGEKLSTQSVRIDGVLLQRLQRDVNPGDELDVTLTIEWGSDDYATHLSDFSTLNGDSVAVPPRARGMGMTEPPSL